MNKPNIVTRLYSEIVSRREGEGREYARDCLNEQERSHQAVESVERRTSAVGPHSMPLNQSAQQ
jgi:hypothetical protein